MTTRLPAHMSMQRARSGDGDEKDQEKENRSGWVHYESSIANERRVEEGGSVEMARVKRREKEGKRKRPG